MRPQHLALMTGLFFALPSAALPEGDAQTAGVAQTLDAAPAVIDPMAPREARDVTLEEFLWVARPLIIFADSPADPRVREQLQMLADRPDVLAERDVVIIIDTDPSEETALRQALRPRGFSLVIVQKDGRVGLRRPSPRDVREIIRGIDNFALRQEEMQSRP
jgi:F420-dependent methylenetetrahydromethanopterin dehydrogenase